jgi:hypothetical protein
MTAGDTSAETQTGLPLIRVADLRLPIQYVDYTVFTIFFVATLVFPMQQRWPVRIALFAVFIATRILALHLQNRLRFNFYNLHLPLAYALFGAAYCFYGIFAGNPGPVQVSPLHVFYPLALGFLAATCTLSEAKKVFRLLFLLCGLDSFLILMVYYLKLKGMQSVPFFDNAVTDFGQGYTKMSFPLLDVLNFSTPFFVFSYRYVKSWRWLYYVVLGLTIIAAVLTGRRATWIVLLASFAGLLVTRQISVGAFVKLVIVAGGAIALAFALGGLNFDVLLSRLLSGFKVVDVVDHHGAYARAQQYGALLRGFFDSPLFGHGLGATAAEYGVIRSFQQPWAYELVYVYYFYALGLFGVTVYGLSILWLLAKMREFAAKFDLWQYHVPLIAGLVGFMMAGSSNPYLQKIDYIFVFFVPYAFITACIAEQRASIGSSASGSLHEKGEVGEPN